MSPALHVGDYYAASMTYWLPHFYDPARRIRFVGWRARIYSREERDRYTFMIRHAAPVVLLYYVKVTHRGVRK